MLSVLLIMLCSGLLGATISTGLSDNGRTWLAWRWGAVTGVGAALLVPLFLQTVSSRLLADLLGTAPATEQYFVFGGFCLLAAISSKRFITTLSERVLQEAKAAAQQAAEARSEVRALATQAEETRDVALAAVDAAHYGLSEAPAAKGRAAPPASAAVVVEPGPAEDDPWAHAFGERAEAQGRRLEARIKEVRGRPGWCTVALRVVGTDPRRPLEGTVQFFLHPTFMNYTPTVAVQDGAAELSFTSWGAFTVGALCDGGQTRLELDLAAHPDAPEPWRSR